MVSMTSKRLRYESSEIAAAAVALQDAEKRVCLARALCKELEDLYSGHDTLMWDTTQVSELVRPTRNFDRNSRNIYKYVGRAGAAEIYNSMLDMEAGQHMQVLGARGSGKSTVVSTISGYLIGSRKKRLVYLCAKRFIEDPLCLLDALLVACGRNDDVATELVSLTTLERLVGFCSAEPDGSLLFVVDDWDQFENAAALETVLKRACAHHMLVKVSSVNSRERHIWSESDKADDDIKTLHFDGPYTSSELKTWIGQSGLTVAELRHLDRLAGGMPRLLRFYEETKGNEHAFLGKIKGTCTQKIFKKFIGLLQSPEELRHALYFVVSGELSHILAGKVDFSCFYMKDDLYHPLCPYFRNVAESFIMDQHEILKCSLNYNDIQAWVEAVKLDCEAVAPRNPARIGWNVEGLVISVMRFKKKVFTFDFKFYKTYEHGDEMAALRKLTQTELEGGVLMGPLAFNEKAVDVIYLKLVGTVLQIKALEITVAQWKAKDKKQSHKVWENEVLPKWTPGKKKWTVSQEFYYIMPESVSLENVAPGSPLFRRLSDVDNCLSELDDVLNLEEPVKCRRERLKQCEGLNRTTGECCENKARCEAASYYCFKHAL